MSASIHEKEGNIVSQYVDVAHKSCAHEGVVDDSIKGETRTVKHCIDSVYVCFCGDNNGLDLNKFKR